jgi:hypothetical protein
LWWQEFLPFIRWPRALGVSQRGVFLNNGNQSMFFIALISFLSTRMREPSDGKSKRSRSISGTVSPRKMTPPSDVRYIDDLDVGSSSTQTSSTRNCVLIFEPSASQKIHGGQRIPRDHNILGQATAQINLEYTLRNVKLCAIEIRK